MHVQCVSCGGTYDDVTADGYLYFHTCPPLSVAELQKAVDTARVVLPADETVEIAHGLRSYLRASARNENVGPPLGRDKTPSIIAEGKGVIPIAPPARKTAPVIVPD